MDWTGFRVSDFADRELEVPYYLEHFHTIANSVVERGPTRGFLDIAVWRRAKDNKPFNARVMEGHTTFAYFYCTKRPWNRYHGMPAVKDRLEAMLEFWCNSQSPDGFFSEYSQNGWNLAATGFGAMCMSQTLELLESGGPTIDKRLLGRTTECQRRAIMALLTSQRLRDHARQFSNQYTGVYRAAVVYLKSHDDQDMRRALSESVAWAGTNLQSPAGFMYELNGPDFGYSRVHEGNLHALRGSWGIVPSDLRRFLIDENERWAKWLGHNLLPEPDGAGYYVNAAVERRTSYAFQPFQIRPLAEFVAATRAFAITGEEYDRSIAERRARLEKEWPPRLPLHHSEGFDYVPWMPFHAANDTNPWFPTRTQREKSIAALPPLTSDSFVSIASDARDPESSLTCVFARKPSYYAIFNYGPNHRYLYDSDPNTVQSLGLGLIWNEQMGTVLQAIAQSKWRWGTIVGDSAEVRETGPLEVRMRVNGQVTNPAAGWSTPADGAVDLIYDLSGSGRKRVLLGTGEISVDVAAPGAIVEQLPLVKAADAKIEKTATSYAIVRNASRFTISWDASVTSTLSSSENIRIEQPSLRRLAHADGLLVNRDFRAERILLSLSGKDALRYRMRVSGAPDARR
ncbi:MAG: hypothetical protein WCJ18_01365 [Planctomycetota bacterium]